MGLCKRTAITLSSFFKMFPIKEKAYQWFSYFMSGMHYSYLGGIIGQKNIGVEKGIEHEPLHQGFHMSTDVCSMVYQYHPPIVSTYSYLQLTCNSLLPGLDVQTCVLLGI